MTNDLAAALAEVLTEKLGRPVTVSGLKRLAGDCSHETWAFDASAISIDEGHPRFEGVQPLILRRGFSAGLPEPWLFAAEDSALGTPFIVMANCTTGPRT